MKSCSNVAVCLITSLICFSYDFEILCFLVQWRVNHETCIVSGYIIVCVCVCVSKLPVTSCMSCLVTRTIV